MFDGDSLLSFKRDAEMTATMTATIDRKATVSGGLSFGALSDAECVLKLNMLIKQWQEPGPLRKVRSSDSCPDAANRAKTGLAVHPPDHGPSPGPHSMLCERM